MIPFFGITIPNLSGLFGDITYISYWYWLGYIYFILLSFIIWHGNRWLLFKQREYNDWFSNPVRKLSILVSANIFYTAPVTVIWLRGWYTFVDFPGTDWDAIYLVTLMNVIAVIFITHVYETVLLIKERGKDLVEVEQLKRSKVESELEILKSQIDPHFMFNTLNTMAHLIEMDSKRALQFNENLSDVYRYILSSRNNVLVLLQDEIEFLNNYFDMLKIRFEKGLELHCDLKQGDKQYLIPPMSLQLLLENAVKHNEFDSSGPLVTTIRQTDSRLIISNNKKAKKLLKPTSGIGLYNLNERYKLITGKEIIVEETEETFNVTLPIIGLENE
jgi:sensor histidine kinase YesM